VLTFTKNGTRLKPGIEFPKLDVLVEGSRIVRVAPTISETEHPNAKVIDATDHLVSPGFVDVHRHLWKSMMRAFAGNQTLLEYMGQFEIDARNRLFAPEDVYYGQLAGALEAIHAGVTTVLDHSQCSLTPEHASSAIGATLRSGLRSVYAYARRPYDAKDSARQWQLSEIERLGRSIATLGGNDGRVTLGMAYDNVKSDPVSAARETVDIARHAGAKIITFHHVPIVRGRGAIARMNAANLLDEGFVVSHANYVDEDEFAHLRRAGAGVAVTPETELQMGHGDAEGFRCLWRGNRVGLGADCQTVCSGDMFSQMRLHLQYSRASRNFALQFDGKSLGKLAGTMEYTTDQILRMATMGGAEVLQMENEIGSIEEGKRADLFLLDLRGPGLLGSYDPSQAMVLFANANDVRTVLVNGEVVKDDGRLTRVEFPTFVREFQSAQERFLKRVESSNVDWDAHAVHVRRNILGVPDERLVW
jgi:cytosine/adenosine deaminase-related metal-dependent hydrolase